MIVYVLLTMATVAAARFIRQEEAVYADGSVNKQYLYNRAALFAIFLALFFVSALRLNVGNDYATYVEFMHRIGSGFTDYVPTEAGFNYLTKAVYAVSGFENYLTVFALFSAGTAYFFLKAIRMESKCFAASFALFMLFGYYFRSMSAVRYYFALAVALYAFAHVMRGDYVRFVLLILFGALFHKSILVVLVLYPLSLMKWNKWMAGLLAICCAASLLLRGPLFALAVRLYNSYEETAEANVAISVVNIVSCAAVLLAALYLGGRDVLQNVYVHAMALALLLHLFGSFIPLISRIAYYVSVTQVFLLPEVIERLPKEREGRRITKRTAYMALFAVAVCYFAAFLLTADKDGIRLLPYQTAIFHEMPPILSEMGVH